MSMNKQSTSYETYSLLLFNGSKFRNISGKYWVSLMLDSFRNRDFKDSAITLL